MAIKKKDEYEQASAPPQYIPKTYKPGEEVAAANEALRKNSVQSPGQYQSKWDKQLSETADKILNREEFSYDVNGDALYKQYADKFTRQGKTAMDDTIARASAMTGGYGNSYAQTAGQAAYAGEMQKLGDKIPELYQLALDKYTREGDELRDNLNMIRDMEELDYGRHRDKVGDWRTEREYLIDRADTAYNRDYGEWSDKRDEYKYSFDVTHGDWYELGDRDREDAIAAADAKASYGDFSGYAELYGVDKNAARAMFEKEQANEAYATLAERITAAGYTPTDEELASAGMTRGEANSYAYQYNLGIAKTQNSVYGTGETSSSSGDADAYGGYTREKFTEAIMKYQNSDSENAVYQSGAFAVSVGTPEALRVCEIMTGGVSAYYDEYGKTHSGIMPKDEWTTAKQAGIDSEIFTDHATYEEYYKFMTE